MLANTIIQKLKTGSIKNVYLFSDIDEYPSPPYVIVKPEKGTKENTRQIRIMAYMIRGFYDQLSAYIINEVNELLGAEVYDEDGTRYNLFKGGYTDVIGIPEDNCYFMERTYIVPMYGIE